MSRAHLMAVVCYGLVDITLAFQGEINNHVEMKKKMFW